MASKQYLNGKSLYKEIIVSKASGKLTPEALEMFYLLVKNVSRKFTYINEDDRDDCKSEAIYTLLKNWQSFDEGRHENAFAYYTEITKRAFAKGWNILYKKDSNNEWITPLHFSRMFENEIKI